MTETYFEKDNNSANTTELALRQQGPDYARLLTVAPSGPCEHNRHINILRLPDVMKRVGLKHTAIYLRISQGKFPKQISLGGRAVGWLEHEIDAWLIARIQEARGLSQT